MLKLNELHIPAALNILRPNAQWVLRGDTIEDLEWNDTIQTKPTQEEIDIQLSQMQLDNTNK
jgi:hypothetical protein